MIEQREHLRTFLRALHPTPSADRLVQFVLLQGKATQQRWLWTRNQEDAVISDLLSWNAHGWDCYVGVNPRLTMAGGERKNIAAVTALPVDFDAKKMQASFSGVERELVRLNFPNPSIQVTSGNGVHAYWLLNDEQHPDETEEICERLGLLCASDDVWNASRIMRLPGTVNWKNPPTWCRWELLTEARYGLAALDQRLTEIGIPAREPELEAIIPLAVPPNIQAAVDRVPTDIQNIILTGKAPNYPSHSEADWAVACALFNVGCTTAQVTAVFRLYPIAGLKVASSPPSYLSRTLARAKSQVARDLATRARTLLLPQPPFAELSPGRFAIRMTETLAARNYWR